MTLAQKLYEASLERLPVPLFPLPPWERLDVDAQAHWEALADVAMLEAAGSDASTANARVEELLDLLAALVKQRKGIEFSTTEEQATWRKAKAVLVREGR